MNRQKSRLFKLIRPFSENIFRKPRSSGRSFVNSNISQYKALLLIRWSMARKKVYTHLLLSYYKRFVPFLFHFEVLGFPQRFPTIKAIFFFSVVVHLFEISSSRCTKQFSSCDTFSMIFQAKFSTSRRYVSLEWDLT